MTDTQERAAFLRQVCASDEALRREVASLLVQPVKGWLAGPHAAAADRTRHREGPGRKEGRPKAPACAALRACEKRACSDR